MSELENLPSAETHEEHTETRACDLISRQAAIDLARDIYVTVKDGSFYRHRCIDPDELRELPPAQIEQHWIPCSEKLPEVNEKPYYIDPIDGNELFESEQVLVFGKNENGYDYSVASHIYSTESGDEWGNAYDSEEVELTTILAWMPLPEPYREEGEG